MKSGMFEFMTEARDLKVTFVFMVSRSKVDYGRWKLLVCVVLFMCFTSCVAFMHRLFVF